MSLSGCTAVPGRDELPDEWAAIVNHQEGHHGLSGFGNTIE